MEDEEDEEEEEEDEDDGMDARGAGVSWSSSMREGSPPERSHTLTCASRSSMDVARYPLRPGHHAMDAVRGRGISVRGWFNDRMSHVFTVPSSEEEARQYGRCGFTARLVTALVWAIHALMGRASLLRMSERRIDLKSAPWMSTLGSEGSQAKESTVSREVLYIESVTTSTPEGTLPGPSSRDWRERAPPEEDEDEDEDEEEARP